MLGELLSEVAIDFFIEQFHHPFGAASLQHIVCLAQAKKL
jgi:hypothetical protein